MTGIQCLINGRFVSFSDQPDSSVTLLYWLREQAGLTGTKEGCNEGDCGACTVLVSDFFDGKPRHRAMNACLVFLSQCHRKAIRTVEGVASHGALHPVQSQMVKHHASQCGFCTPGFVMSLVAAQAEGRDDDDDVLAGNLCRCTGYAAIIRAAEAARGDHLPQWIAEDMKKIQELNSKEQSSQTISSSFLPQNLDDLCTWYQKHPEATLVAGATDVGLWVTKELRDLGKCAFLANIPELAEITETADEWSVGATVTMNRFQEFLRPIFRDFAEMLRRFGSVQVRHAATLGGNIANGSPIGDSAPALIALDARLELRLGKNVRQIAIEEFFLDYGKQNRHAGEVLTRIIIPQQPDHLRCYKISKRVDQDISALCGCFAISIKDGKVNKARIAFGGMAGIPARAREVEKVLLDQPWTEEILTEAEKRMPQDFTPLSDMRASAGYRLLVAQNLLWRYFYETTESAFPTRVLEVLE